jgi:hypothetical protein
VGSPVWVLPLEVQRFGVGERPHPEEVVVSVGHAGGPGERPSPGRRAALPRPEKRIEVEVGGQVEGAVVAGPDVKDSATTGSPPVLDRKLENRN